MRYRELNIFKIRNFLRNCLDFFGIFEGIFLDFSWIRFGGFFWIFLGFFLKEFFGGFFYEDILGEEFFVYIASQPAYLNLKGIDTFVKIFSQ